MATVITGTPHLDKAEYNAGDTITVTVPDLAATSTVHSSQALVITATADDGSETVFDAPNVAVTRVTHPGVRITAVTLDGAAGTVAADGLSATAVAV
jgi:hypothetical protein